MDAVVARLIAMLQAGDTAGARALEKTWREDHDGDDCRRASPFAAARWFLVRELIGVAADLPSPVLGALADALTASDLSNARPALISYRLEHARLASTANEVLALRAPSIFKQVEHTLWIPPKPRAPAPVPSIRPSQNRGVSSVLGIVGSLIGAVAIFATSGHSSDHAYSKPPDIRLDDIPDIKIPDFKIPDYQIPDLKVPDFNADLPPIRIPTGVTSPAGPPATTRTGLAHEILEASRLIATAPGATAPQRAAATALERAAKLHSCRKMQAALADLDAAPRSTDDAGGALWIMEREDEIRERLARYCPAPAPKAHP